MNITRKLIRKGYILYDSQLNDILEKAKLWTQQKDISSCQRLWGGKDEYTEHRKFTGQ